MGKGVKTLSEYLLFRMDMGYCDVLSACQLLSLLLHCEICKFMFSTKIMLYLKFFTINFPNMTYLLTYSMEQSP